MRRSLSILAFTAGLLAFAGPSSRVGFPPAPAACAQEAPPAEPAQPPVPPGAAPQQASNILNPNLSLVGNMAAYAGNDPALSDRAFEFLEAEIGLQAAIDPFSRADVFIAVSGEGVEVEEATVTWLALPASLGLRAGKFRSSFGKFNRTHPPETPFLDRPKAAERLFGEEGLASVGLSASYLSPTPFYLNIDLEATTNWDEAPLFGEETESGEIEAGGGRSDLGYLARLSAYHDFTEETNIFYGLSWAHGVHDPGAKLASDAWGADATVRWKDPRRAIYRSFTWQTEAYYARRSEVGDDTDVRGGFSYVEYQFARRWRTGLRGDYIEEPIERGTLAYLTFWPSEFSALSVQGLYSRGPEDRDDLSALLKLTFNIGPHGAHPF